MWKSSVFANDFQTAGLDESLDEREDDDAWTVDDDDDQATVPYCP